MNGNPRPGTATGGANLPWLRLGFRPFFLAAAAWSVIAMAAWMAVAVFSVPLAPDNLPSAYWHAHEMVYGYAMAVVAGFLLTAVRNWTGIQTLRGWPLLALLLTWLTARAFTFIANPDAWMFAMLMDGVFVVWLSAALTWPLIQARMWKNIGVVSKVYFMLAGHVLFALGMLGRLEDGQRMGIYVGLYMIVSLILVLSRRVLPMFIERGVGYPVMLKNRLWVDIACFLLFMVFAVTDIFFSTPSLTAWCAAALFLLHGIRLSGWHTPGIWKKPMLWVLYVAYIWMVVGFGLKFMAHVADFSPSLAIHAFTAGGIGMMTLGMMARVSLGHTGRDVSMPPRGVGLMFLSLALAACVRVVFPLALAGDYVEWIALSQALWIAAFVLFLALYAPMLVRARIDGRPG